MLISSLRLISRSDYTLWHPPQGDRLVDGGLGSLLGGGSRVYRHDLAGRDKHSRYILSQKSPGA
jgi:hypothetical protein